MVTATITINELLVNTTVNKWSIEAVTISVRKLEGTLERCLLKPTFLTCDLDL